MTQATSEPAARGASRCVAVVGATGLIGAHLVAALRRRGDQVVALSRRATDVAGVRTVVWTPGSEPLPRAACDGVDAIVNLAGEPLAAGRWTPARRAAIEQSRVAVTRAVAAAMGDAGPPVLVSASAVGYYGVTASAVDETAPAGGDFLASVCVAWEREAQVAASRGARVVLARTGIVLARDGGALPRLVRVGRLGGLGRLGSGDQWFAWIHVDDEVAALVHCLDHEVAGPVNVVAPHAVRQRELAAALRHRLRRPPAPPVPAPLLRAALGSAADLLLTGQHAVPAVLESEGFTFRHPRIEGALTDLV